MNALQNAMAQFTNESEAQAQRKSQRIDDHDSQSYSAALARAQEGFQSQLTTLAGEKARATAEEFGLPSAVKSITNLGSKVVGGVKKARGLADKAQQALQAVRDPSRLRGKGAQESEDFLKGGHDQANLRDRLDENEPTDEMKSQSVTERINASNARRGLKPSADADPPTSLFDTSTTTAGQAPDPLARQAARQTSSRSNRVNNNAIGDDDEDAPYAQRAARQTAREETISLQRPDSISTAGKGASGNTVGGAGDDYDSGGLTRGIDPNATDSSMFKPTPRAQPRFQPKEAASDLPDISDLTSPIDFRGAQRLGAPAKVLPTSEQDTNKVLSSFRGSTGRTGAQSSIQPAGAKPAAAAEDDVAQRTLPKLATAPESTAAKIASTEATLAPAEEAEAAIPGLGEILEGLTAIGGAIAGSVESSKKAPPPPKVAPPPMPAGPTLAFNAAPVIDSADYHNA